MNRMGFGNIFAGGGVQLKKVQPVVKTVQRVSVVREEPKYTGTTTIGQNKPAPAANLNQSKSTPQQAKVKQNKTKKIDLM